jgi:Haem-binding domain
MRASRIISTLGVSLVLLSQAQRGFAHEQHHAETMKSKSISAETADNNTVSINEVYLKEVKPIFKRSCFDCHSSSTSYPWYSKIPGAKQIIENDIRESKEHLDLSNDFPFGGHGTPTQDLEAIDEVIKEGSMPPFRYRILHSKSNISADEKLVIENWVKSSLEKLGADNSGHKSAH